MGGVGRRIHGEYDQSTVYKLLRCHKIYPNSTSSTSKPCVPSQRRFKIRMEANPNPSASALSGMTQVTGPFLEPVSSTSSWDVHSSFLEDSKKYFLSCLGTLAAKRY